MEEGSPEQRRATKARRVLSPSAAKTRAFALGFAVMRLRIFRDMAFDDRPKYDGGATEWLHVQAGGVEQSGIITTGLRGCGADYRAVIARLDLAHGG
jgi:hypothetical protein